MDTEKRYIGLQLTLDPSLLALLATLSYSNTDFTRTCSRMYSLSTSHSVTGTMSRLLLLLVLPRTVQPF